MPQTPLIAIVDDDESMRQALAGFIQSVGYRAQAFRRAEDFLRDGRAAHTSCLISDMQMPGMTGLELHRRLVESRRHIPTILITAYPNELTEAQALRAGVLCYLPKPFNEDRLLDCIGCALGAGDRHGEAP